MIISIISSVTFYFHIWICGHVGTFRRSDWLAGGTRWGFLCSDVVFSSVKRNPQMREHATRLDKVKCKNGLSHERAYGPSLSIDVLSFYGAVRQWIYVEFLLSLS